ncbi:hypothetical protein SDC9_185181 [bioreactor metagenome]|uniref:Uncharacterized protein n=1 Tax=bioreactor metagenome TaxID=1076179 RepID=A0A645HF76_9ZZZZ
MHIAKIFLRPADVEDAYAALLNQKLIQKERIGWTAGAKGMSLICDAQCLAVPLGFNVLCQQRVAHAQSMFQPKPLGISLREATTKPARRSFAVIIADLAISTLHDECRGQAFIKLVPQLRLRVIVISRKIARLVAVKREVIDAVQVWPMLQVQVSVGVVIVAGIELVLTVHVAG